jgi:hypothetical protein
MITKDFVPYIGAKILRDHRLSVCWLSWSGVGCPWS